MIRDVSVRNYHYSLRNNPEQWVLIFFSVLTHLSAVLTTVLTHLSAVLNTVLKSPALALNIHNAVLHSFLTELCSSSISSSQLLRTSHPSSSPLIGYHGHAISFQCTLHESIFVVLFLLAVSSFISTVPVHWTQYNPLTPNDHYSDRTAPLTSKRCILYIYSTNIGTEYFEHGINSPFFSLQMQFVS